MPQERAPQARAQESAEPTRLIETMLSRQLEVTRALIARVDAIQARPSLDSWSAQEQLVSLLCDPDTPRMIKESASWSVEMSARLRDQLTSWSELSEERRGQVSRLISLIEHQGLKLNELPEWLLSVEGCRAQIETYLSYLSVYEEVAGSHKRGLSREPLVED